MGGRDVEGGEGCVVGLEEPERGLRGGGVGADVVVVEDAVVGGNLRELGGDWGKKGEGYVEEV